MKILEELRMNDGDFDTLRAVGDIAWRTSMSVSSLPVMGPPAITSATRCRPARVLPSSPAGLGAMNRRASRRATCSNRRVARASRVILAGRFSTDWRRHAYTTRVAGRVVDRARCLLEASEQPRPKSSMPKTKLEADMNRLRNAVRAVRIASIAESKALEEAVRLPTVEARAQLDATHFDELDAIQMLLTSMEVVERRYPQFFTAPQTPVPI